MLSPTPNIRLSFEALSNIVSDVEECQRLDDDDERDSQPDANIVQFWDGNDDPLAEEQQIPAPKRQEASSQAADPTSKEDEIDEST